MKTRKRVGLAVFALAVAVTAVLSIYRRGSGLGASRDKGTSPVSRPAPHTNAFPAFAAASQVKPDAGRGDRVEEPDLPPAALARWRELEELGHLPPGANVWDLRLAVLTSWWGRSLDPTNFWKGRPIWMDQVSVTQAGMFGRSFPPIPPGDHHLPVYHERKKTDAERLADSMTMTIPPNESTSAESAFWETWRRTHPNPPEKIAEVQFKIASDLLSFSNENEADIRARIIREAVVDGMPPEAFTKEAFKWALVEGTRRE